MSDSSHLMPDTSDVNFYTADPDLAFLLQRYLSAEDNHRAQSILTHMGAVASEQMDELAEVANRQGPALKQFDKRGQRVDEVIFHPAYHELERITYEEFAIAACTHREGALGWPCATAREVCFRLSRHTGGVRSFLSCVHDRCTCSRYGALRQ
jgi:AidA-like protein